MVRGTRRLPAALVPWLGTLARLLLAAIFAVAASSKITDLAASGRSVNAYQLMPYGLAKLIGGLLAVYIAGIASVWARGLSIDCGCFSQGGQLASGQHPSYLLDILRDV